MAKIKCDRKEDHRDRLVRGGQRYGYDEQQRGNTERDLQDGGVQQGIDALRNARGQVAARHPVPVNDDQQESRDRQNPVIELDLLFV